MHLQINAIRRHQLLKITLKRKRVEKEMRYALICQFFFLRATSCSGVQSIRCTANEHNIFRQAGGCRAANRMLRTSLAGITAFTVSISAAANEKQMFFNLELKKAGYMSSR